MNSQYIGVCTVALGAESGCTKWQTSNARISKWGSASDSRFLPDSATYGDVVVEEVVDIRG